ncbi:hypothetical protein [Silvimonas iriomotensis]|uniref:Uncharacterized protein n=1 Tax=Silvimonas iriomotensis TaxID=449662 RepID=A0ABQ2P736_9NEIS|nr:hypothetical protein [Silvimonas iriomotensis]GGP19713.1 hypothetical protein GCM10010970_11980 [Silvimonas iriomotensis]
MRFNALWAGCLLAVAAQAHADGLRAPQTLRFDDQTWSQVWHKKAGKQEVYEYTTNGEQSEDWKWTRLITLNRLNTGKITALEWNKSVSIQLQKAKVQDFQLGERNNDQDATALIIYPPSPTHPVYETNAWLTRYVQSCGGLVSWQLARQIADAPADASADEKQKAHVAAADAARADLALLLKQDWQPECE